MHTTCSDGELNPVELIKLASKQGLTHVSITDHDTILAYNEAIDAAELYNIELINGIEFNTSGPNGELHILGYGINLSNLLLINYCDWRRNDRIGWSKEIVKKLNELSYEIKWGKCFDRATGGIIVRTHIADELVDQGYFKTNEEAFETLLDKGKAAYIERAAFTSKEAINLIHECGGVAFLAHPGIYKFAWSLDVLIDEGVDGIEVFYAKHDKAETEKWLKRAIESGLATSIGSDFHGETSRNPQMIGTVRYDEKLVHPWLQLLLNKEATLF